MTALAAAPACRVLRPPAISTPLPEEVVDALVTIADHAQAAWDAQGTDCRTRPAIVRLVQTTPLESQLVLHRTAQRVRDAYPQWGPKTAAEDDVDHYVEELSCEARALRSCEAGDHDPDCDLFTRSTDVCGCIDLVAGRRDDAAANLLGVVAVASHRHLDAVLAEVPEGGAA